MSSILDTALPGRLLLCTDLDRTLLPNGPQPESDQAREIFSRLVAQSQVTLVYVTGRHRQLVEQAVEEYQLPRPDYVISDVGSSIYQLTATDWDHQQNWKQLIAADWQGKNTDQLQSLFADIGSIRLQEQSKQNALKLSYYVELNLNHQTILSMMQERLKQQSIAANLVWSIDEQQDIGLLDVLPASAGKRQAIEFLMQQLGYGVAETVFAGDSGNDLDVLCSPIHSVLVANADPQVREMALAQSNACQRQSSLYLARGDFMQMNGNYSAGILEGVAHFVPAAEQWMRGEA